MPASIRRSNSAPKAKGGGTNSEAITRLRDGATWQEADAEINRAWSHRAHRYELDDDPGAQVTYHSVPLQKGETATLRPQVLALMLAAGFILLIACANLAGSDTGAHAAAHARGCHPTGAGRLALADSKAILDRKSPAGSGRRSGWHRQSAFVSPTRVAAASARAFSACGSSTSRWPRTGIYTSRFPLDQRAFWHAAGACHAQVSICAPPSPVAPQPEGDRLRLRQALIAGEVALTVVLLAASGLLIRTLIHLETLPPGFDPNGVMIAKASLDDARFHDPATFRKLLDESTAAMRQIPGGAECRRRPEPAL